MQERVHNLEQLGVNIKKLAYGGGDVVDVMLDILVEHKQRINHLEECLSHQAPKEETDNWQEVKELTDKLFKDYGEDNIANSINQMVNTDYTQLGVDIGKVLDALFAAVKKGK